MARTAFLADLAKSAIANNQPMIRKVAEAAIAEGWSKQQTFFFVEMFKNELNIVVCDSRQNNYSLNCFSKVDENSGLPICQEIKDQIVFPISVSPRV